MARAIADKHAWGELGRWPLHPALWLFLCALDDGDRTFGGHRKVPR
jgi:hypothetical protein